MMDKISSIWKFTSLLYSLPLLIGVIFIYLAYLNSSAHDPSIHSQSFILWLSVIIPEIIVWMLATVSAVRFKQYTVSIKGSKDGDGLNHVANALLILVVYIVLLTMANNVVSLFVGSVHLDTAVAIGNHLPIAVALISVAYLFVGSLKLSKFIKKSMLWTPQRTAVYAAGVFILFVVFAWSFYRAVPNLEPIDGVPRFALPVEVLLFTYVLTHIALWSFGILSCINLVHFASKVKGRIYKSLFRDLCSGILLVFLCIFLSQFIIISSITVSSFSSLYFLVYLILALALLGFGLIYRGAKKLQKIENPL